MSIDFYQFETEDSLYELRAFVATIHADYTDKTNEITALCAFLYDRKREEMPIPSASAHYAFVQTVITIVLDWHRIDNLRPNFLTNCVEKRSKDNTLYPFFAGFDCEDWVHRSRTFKIVEYSALRKEVRAFFLLKLKALINAELTRRYS